MRYFSFFLTIFALYNKDMSNPLKSKFMNENFVLSEKLRLYLSLGSCHKFLRLGDRFQVSVRKRYSFSQTIVIYQELDYDFFTAREIHYLMSLADNLDLDLNITTENGLPVVEITDYSLNDK